MRTTQIVTTSEQVSVSSVSPERVWVEHVFGNPEAPVTVLEYGDYECPYCAAAAPVLRKLIDSSDGMVRLQFRNFPLFEVHPHALVAALAAESTAQAGPEPFWKMHKLLFEKQDRLTDRDLRLYAEHAGGDPDLAVGEAAQQFADKVRADYAAGIEAGVEGTPTLYINGSAYSGRIDLGALQRATGLSGRYAPRIRHPR
jgi:protein-disulfide isomerase